jgi:predicted LPLAT superfamily acyltransferase
MAPVGRAQIDGIADIGGQQLAELVIGIDMLDTVFLGEQAPFSASPVTIAVSSELPVWRMPGSIADWVMSPAPTTA